MGKREYDYPSTWGIVWGVLLGIGAYAMIVGGIVLWMKGWSP